ncbi:MAG: diguanylate cyclase [bacterium]|nr:diguanylate cyclase [bacterium]
MAEASIPYTYDLAALKQSQSLKKPLTLLALGMGENDSDYLNYLSDLGYVIERPKKVRRLYDQILAQIPNVLLINIDTLKDEAIEIIRKLKENPLTYTSPIIIVLGEHELMREILVLEAGAEDFVVKPVSPRILAARIHTSMRRNVRLQVSNPLTGLPGALCVEEQVTRRLDEKVSTAMCYADLDYFKAFNDTYGYSRGDNVIRILATILHEAITMHGSENDFVGHIGGDDFIMIVRHECVEPICAYICQSFDALIPFQYDEEDMRVGYITSKNRQGEEMRFPLMTVSIGVVTNERRVIESYLYMTELAAKMKEFAKSIVKSASEPKSIFRVDQRIN